MRHAATASLNPQTPKRRLMPETDRLPDSMAPCGVYCGACPSFGKGCRGCSSENRKQRRTSKWNCKIRRCCFEEKGLALCSQCTDFPGSLTDRLRGSCPRTNDSGTVTRSTQTSGR